MVHSIVGTKQDVNKGGERDKGDIVQNVHYIPLPLLSPHFEPISTMAVVCQVHLHLFRVRAAGRRGARLEQD
jgi:hypothetical protein